MIYLLEKAKTYSNPWNYTFLVVAIIAIIIGTIITLVKLSKQQKNSTVQKSDLYNEDLLDNPEDILKKK